MPDECSTKNVWAYEDREEKELMDLTTKTVAANRVCFIDKHLKFGDSRIAGRPSYKGEARPPGRRPSLAEQLAWAAGDGNGGSRMSYGPDENSTMPLFCHTGSPRVAGSPAPGW